MMSDTTAPVTTANPDGQDDDEGAPPRLQFSARNVLVLGAFLAASIAALYYLLPQIAGLEDTWERIEDGSPYWMFLAFVFALGMFAGYVMMFRGVFARVPGGERIGWRESYQITMAGLAASRIFAAGGAGGLVLTAWALRRAGLRKRHVADRTLSFLILTYFPYVLAVIVCGLGLRLGIFGGEAPFGLTVVPAILAGIALGIGLAIALVPTDLQRRLSGWAGSHGRLARFAQLAANAPASASAGMRDAIAHVRSRDPALLGAILFWAAQILVLRALTPAQVVRGCVLVAVASVVFADASPEVFCADRAAQHVQHPSALLIREPVQHLAHVRDVAMDDGLIGRSLLRGDDGADVGPQPSHQGVAAVELLAIQVREVGREPLAQPHIVPVFLCDGVTPPLVRNLVDDGRASGGDALLAVEDRRSVLGSTADACRLHVCELLRRRGRSSR